MTEDTPPATQAIKDLKQATSRARHALHQYRRYPNSQGVMPYLDKSKAEVRKAYEALGELLAEEHLL